MTIDNTQDIIDSRDIIERINELQEWLDAIPSDDPMLAIKLGSPDAEELKALKALSSQAEDSPDWTHGEQLIRRSYFVQYIEELIDDCYSMPKEMKSGEWPWRHFKLDYEAAAKEAEVDYIEVDFDGVEYLIRA